MQHVAVSNGMLNVYAQGKGTPFLFVHGFPLNNAMWHLQTEPFSKKYRVIVPDLRGFGESTVTPGTVTMEEMADDLHGVLHGVWVDKPVVFCGLVDGRLRRLAVLSEIPLAAAGPHLVRHAGERPTRPKGRPDATSWPKRFSPTAARRLQTPRCPS